VTREDELDGLIGTLYEAALEPELWREAIEGLLRMVDAQIGHLYFLERNSGRVTSSIMLGPGHKREDIEQIDADYSGYYRTIDPRQAVAARAGVGEWILCHEHWDEAFVRRSEFFNDFLIPSGMRYLLGARVGDMDEHSVFIGMLRAVGHRPFGEDEVRRIKRIEHHLARAARLYFKSEGLRRKLDSGLAALDALDFAALIVDQIGAVHFANSATEGLLRRKGVALKVRGSRLSHAVPEINVRLETLLREAVVGGKGGGMRLSRGREGPDLHLLVVPLSARSRLAAPWQMPLALLLVSDPTTRRMPPDRFLRLLFGLSPTEVRLAEALVAGLSPGEYAADAGVSMNTVRTQIRSMFEKTRTRRQADLVKLLTSLPAIRLDGEIL